MEHASALQSAAIGACDVVLSGSIAGANFQICEPRNNTPWNGCILLYAHGYRPLGHSLTVELEPNAECYRRLLAEGWIVAASSYRREGVIIKDAMDDLKNLRQVIVERYCNTCIPAPRCVILEGQSMGGGICTRLAEREPQLFNAVLCVGAALMTRTDQQTPEDLANPLLHKPAAPILFLTNESELGPIKQYITKASAEAAQAQKNDCLNDFVCIPALWTVTRPGHNWTNQLERYSAIRALMSWIQFGTFITCRIHDNTHPPTPPPSAVQFDTSHDGKKTGVSGATGCVTAITLSGTIKTNFTSDDLKALGVVRLGTQICIRVLGGKFYAVFDRYPFVNSQRGGLVAFTEPDHDYVLFGIHNVVGHESAAERAGRLKAGDAFRVETAEKKSGKLSLPFEEGLLLAHLRSNIGRGAAGGQRGVSKI
jgi:pimeloyl-ACP methyl ester carboxylesterase